MRKLIAFLTIALLMAGGPVFGQQPAGGNTLEGVAKDAWLLGKVEMAYALNEHLDSFDIDTHVDAGVVSLTGRVDSDIDRDLAVEIAKGIQGVVDVENELEVGPTDSGSVATDNEPAERNFRTWFNDATTTAAVKSRLIANVNTEALSIDVDTENRVVTLSGRTRTAQQKQLAGEIAGNTRNVERVRNLLVVDAAKS